MNDGSAAAAGLLGLGGVVIVLLLLIPLALYVWTALALTKVFRKAGQPAWKAWVPIVNTWTVYELGGQGGWWVLLALLPVLDIVALVFFFIALDAINKRFGLSSGYTVLGIFLFPVWASVLGWGPARLVDGSDGPDFVRGVAPAPLPAASAPPPPPASPFAMTGGSSPAPPGLPSFGSGAPIPPPPGAFAGAVPAPPLPPAAPPVPAPALAAAVPPPPPPPTAPAATPSSPFVPPPPPAPAAPASSPFVPPPAPAAPAIAPTPAPIRAATPAAPAPAGRDPWAPQPAAPVSLPPVDDDDERTVIARPKRAVWTLVLPDGTETVLTSDTVVIGRSPADAAADAQIVSVTDTTKTVSKSHAVLRRHEDGWTLEDQGSTNGSVVIDGAGTEIEISAPHPVSGAFLLGDASFELRTN